MGASCRHAVMPSFIQYCTLYPMMMIRWSVYTRTCAKEWNRIITFEQRCRSSGYSSNSACSRDVGGLVGMGRRGCGGGECTLNGLLASTGHQLLITTVPSFAGRRLHHVARAPKTRNQHCESAHVERKERRKHRGFLSPVHVLCGRMGIALQTSCRIPYRRLFWLDPSHL